MRHALDGLKRGKKGKKISFWVLSFIIVIVFTIIFSSLVITSATNSKVNILRLFKKGTYLIIFQNNSELRATGGFIGSFAEVTFNNYKVENIDFNTNIYKLDKGFSQDHIILPPKPLENISDGKWALRDSNFAVSFPESAEKISWFYKEETGHNIDGIIAINASVARDLLKITGPIELEKYKTTVTYDNFFSELSAKIEKDYFLSKENIIENEPKTILLDLMPILFSKAKREKIQVLKLTFQELLQKQILLYSTNYRIQKSILKENWGGEIQKTNSDYLSVNQTNISDSSNNFLMGGKSSVSVDESLDYKVTKKDERLISSLTITRKHNGNYDFPDGINRNWTRVLVPEGSELLEAKIDNKDILPEVEKGSEAGKTSFAFWMETAPQTTTIINLSYRLSVSEKNYNLLVQKQPGNLGDSLSVTFLGKVIFSGILNEDKKIY